VWALVWGEAGVSDRTARLAVAAASGARNLVVHRCTAYRTHVAKRDWGIAGWSSEKASERDAMKRFSVICSRCGLSVDRVIDAETAQTEIYPVPYQQKCKIAPNAADFDCPELERAVERSRRWDPIFRTAASQSVN
jgi:hypothetical protein